MPSSPTLAFLREIWRAVGGPESPSAQIQILGEDSLPSAFAVSDLAAASIGAAALAVAELVGTVTGRAPEVRVDRRLCSFWFAMSLKPEGWSTPSVWDPIAGDYATSDGWIRLHTNTPHHREAALSVLRVPAEKDAVAAAVSRWRAEEIEAAVIENGGCAAAMRSLASWAEHPQGRSVAAEPFVWREETGMASRGQRAIDPARPLAGIRVLDMTRVLAGPVATRFLAGFGAEVLRIDPPDWDEPGLVPEVTLGKRCARLDLRDPAGRDLLMELHAGADVLVHGYQPSALDHLGLDAQVRRRVRPGLVDVTLDAYGWTGPWARRRGFDSLVQMSAGIADEGMHRFGKDRPTPLPVQALDHATGYIMAAAAVNGLTARLVSGAGSRSRASLARTGALRTSAAPPEGPPSLTTPTASDFDARIEATAWGPARRMLPPVTIDGTAMRWERPASELGSSRPHW